MLSLQRAKARKVEVKLGIAYEGWNKIGKDRYQTIHKMFYADIASSDAFWTGMTFKLHGNYALANIKDSIVGGDGGTGIKDGVDYFNGKFQLCRYHLNREIRHKLGSDKETIRSLQESINGTCSVWFACSSPLGKTLKIACRGRYIMICKVSQLQYSQI